MNIIPYNYHAHTTFCDGTASLEEMVLSAIDRGFKVIGFSGHSCTAYDGCYCMSLDGTRKYKDEIKRLRLKYAGKILILCGIEQDFGSDEPIDDYDYVIGSVHATFPDAAEDARDCFHGFDRSRYYYIDWSTDRIREAVASDFGGDPYSFIEHYYDTVALLPEVTNCHIIGHFDLVTKFNEKEPWFDEASPRYKAAARKALDRIFETYPLSRASKLPGSDGMPIFEINTGAISRGWRTSPYPAPEILKEVRRRGGHVMINSDSHATDTIDFAFETAAKLARACGFTSVKIITERGIEDLHI